jgi:predicted nuclease with TOPRIM domain
MADSTRELKQLQTRLTTLQKELQEAQRDQKSASQQVNEIQGKIKQVRDGMEKLKDKEAVVSEHAILRFFERVLGYDLDEVREIILSGKAAELIDEFRSGKFPQKMETPPTNGEFASSFRLIVKNKVVTTIET